MDIVTLHWDDLELMRLLARHGTAAAAARVLKVDQTTISRRLARMEQGVGTALFDRLERRLVPTQALTAALAALDRMAEAATLAGNALSSERARLTSTVTLSAGDPLATWILAPCMGALAASRPDLAIELRQENRNVSLARREADIALRLGRPDHDEALTRRLATIRYCLAGPVDAACNAACSAPSSVGKASRTEARPPARGIVRSVAAVNRPRVPSDPTSRRARST